MTVRTRVACHQGFCANLREAYCTECGWVGPTRDIDRRGRIMALAADQYGHECPDKAAS